MARIISWNKEQAKKELYKRLSNAKAARRLIEPRWEQAERVLFNTQGIVNNQTIGSSIESNIDFNQSSDEGSTSVGINYVFKNTRLIHSQLSANPPSVVPRPTSNDPSDRRKADAADRFIKYGMRQHKLQERQDAQTLQVLLYGTGICKTEWDTDLGEILECDESTGEIICTGDFSIKVPSLWDIFLDPNAKVEEELDFAFERMLIPWDEACYRFPDAKDLLERYRITSENQAGDYSNRSILNGSIYDAVEIFQYWETGRPYNGMVGRFYWCTRDGDPISEGAPNPFRFNPPTEKGTDEMETARRSQLPGVASLPYHIMTDIDVPGSVYGMSTINYSATAQDVLLRIDNSLVDSISAHGIPRLILPESAEISDDSITNSPYDVVRITGGQPFFFAEALPFPAAANDSRDRMKAGVDDMHGVNESMFGQQSREQSGFSMQYATNQGNLIRRRLFNKYVSLVESVYRAYLNIVRKYWKEKRKIQVLGREKSFEAIDFSGADIDGGFDLVVEYGTSLSLDPISRREEILTMMPVFEKAGVPTRTILSMLKLNELEGVYDKLQLASDRQREIFEEMTVTGRYIVPEELQDHKNMLEYSYDYVMTAEFKYLQEEARILIKTHIKDREAIAAKGVSPQQAPGPVPALTAGGPAAPGMTGEPVAAENMATGQVPTIPPA